MPRFIQRRFPSANTIILGPGTAVDPGHDPGEAAAILGAPSLVLTTHWHSDHAGAVAALQAAGARVAVSALEAPVIAAWSPDAGRAQWLRQCLPPYRADRALAEGDVIEVADTAWTVLALPGHTTQQIGFHDPAARIVIAGDSLHEADIGWLDLDADPAALEHAQATLDQLERLAPRLLLPGHGPAVTDIPAAIARARRRLDTFRRDPARIVFHAAKRIWTHALMTDDGLHEIALEPWLLQCPWFQDHARRLALSPSAFVPVLLNEMLRSGAASWQNRWLVASGDYTGSTRP